MRKGPVTLLAWWGGKLAHKGRGRALCQPASSAQDAWSPKGVLSTGTEDGSVREGVPWVQQPASRISAMLPASHGCSASHVTPQVLLALLLPAQQCGYGQCHQLGHHHRRGLVRKPQLQVS